MIPGMTHPSLVVVRTLITPPIVTPNPLFSKIKSKIAKVQLIPCRGPSPQIVR